MGQYASECTAIEVVRSLWIKHTHTHTYIQRERERERERERQRLARLAVLTYPAEPTQNKGVIQFQLTGIYVDVLDDRDISHDVIREKPAPLAETMKLARGSERLGNDKKGKAKDDGWLIKGRRIPNKREEAYGGCPENWKRKLISIEDSEAWSMNFSKRHPEHTS